jgi:hypothetical protein
MTEAFTRYLSRKGILTDKESAQFLNISFVRAIPKGEFLVREGRLWKQHAFLLEGYLRTYQVNDRGFEKTTGFLADFGEESRLFPKNAIASYLNITPETLSRVKKSTKPD